MVCLIAADIRGETKYIKIGRCELLYEYFRSLELPCVLVKFDIGTGEGETHVAYEDRVLSAMRALTNRDYTAIFSSRPQLDRKSVV